MICAVAFCLLTPLETWYFSWFLPFCPQVSPTQTILGEYNTGARLQIYLQCISSQDPVCLKQLHSCYIRNNPVRTICARTWIFCWCLGWQKLVASCDLCFSSIFQNHEDSWCEKNAEYAKIITCSSFSLMSCARVAAWIRVKTHFAILHKHCFELPIAFHSNKRGRSVSDGVPLPHSTHARSIPERKGRMIKWSVDLKD